MNASNLTTRVLTMTLAVAASACQQRGALAADPAGDPAAPAAPARVTPPAPGKPPVPPPAPTPPAPSKLPGAATAPARPGAAGGYGGGSAGGGFAAGGKSTQLGLVREGMYRVPAADAPAVLVTEPIDEKVQAEWKEDLNVMDKLVRDAVTGGGGGGEMPWIKLTALGGPGGRAAPMYVEGAGVIISTAVAFPLAPAGKDADAPADRPRERASAWVKAQRELKGYGPTDAPGRGGEPVPMTFEQDKLDDFVAAVLKALPEASNFRHLKENESVFVTISGFDESGLPVRMTLKAKKADIDLSASGKMDAETFKHRVARRIG